MPIPPTTACNRCRIGRWRCDCILPSCSRCYDANLFCDWVVDRPAVGETGAIFGDDLANLYASSEATRICNGWTNQLSIPTTQQLDQHPTHVMRLISVTLHSYGDLLADSNIRLPPFVHPAQRSSAGLPESLANCASLLKLAKSAAPGSETMVCDTARRELARLANVVQEPSSAQTLNHQLLILSALQAYLILCIHGYFQSQRHARPAIFSPDQMTVLHDMASKVSAAGIVCPEEVGDGLAISSVAPPWETWIIAEAKRRTILCVYLFEDLYNFGNGAATYLAAELAPPLAPASRRLWNATNRASFEKEYSLRRTVLDGKVSLMVSELWLQKVGQQDDDDAHSEESSRKTKERVFEWKKNLDDFGRFVLDVCTSTSIASMHPLALRPVRG